PRLLLLYSNIITQSNSSKISLRFFIVLCRARTLNLPCLVVFFSLSETTADRALNGAHLNFHPIIMLHDFPSILFFSCPNNFFSCELLLCLPGFSVYSSFSSIIMLIGMLVH
ncbi:unnamed protein product, partial [Pylaiella littoralis]